MTTLFSFFAGSGFLDLGFEKEGFEIVFVNEYDPDFLYAYRYARKEMNLSEPKYGYSADSAEIFLKEEADALSEIVEEEKAKGNIVGFIGGPPCPDFSVAGKGAGKDGKNGRLSSVYINLIIKMEPDFFLFENVKGLWSTKKHRAYYDSLKEGLKNAGYRMTDRLVNALNYGVPQERERVILFGIKENIPQKGIEAFWWDKFQKYTDEEILKCAWPKEEPFQKESKKEFPEGVLQDLTPEYWFLKNDTEHHPNAEDFLMPRAGLRKMQIIPEGDVKHKSYKRLHRFRYSPTACYGNNEVHLHPYKERRLSVSEVLALQSMPKEFVLPPDMTLTKKFKTAGNGVPFLLSEGIAKTIKDFLE